MLRRFSPRFLAAFRFGSNIPHDPMLAAIEVLKAMDRSGARALPKRLPAVRLMVLVGSHAQLMAWLDENCGFGCLVGYLHNE